MQPVWFAGPTILSLLMTMIQTVKQIFGKIRDDVLTEVTIFRYATPCSLADGKESAGLHAMIEDNTLSV
jgi:hypothetical protein